METNKKNKEKYKERMLKLKIKEGVDNNIDN